MTNASRLKNSDSNGLKPIERLIAIVPAGGVGARATAQFEQVNSLTVDSHLGGQMHADVNEKTQHDEGANAEWGQANTFKRPVPKQYQLIAGVPMIRRAVQALLVDPRIERVIVAVQPDDVWAEAVLADLERVNVLPCAGATRALTVLGALNTGIHTGIYRDYWVLVHDAARPGLSPESLARLIDLCLAHPVGGLLALPLADTLKKAHTDSNWVAQTVKRDHMWLAQTPQMFRAQILHTALGGALAAGFEVTDEASAIEWAGHSPLLVVGSVKNAKVTWPEDFEWVGSWLTKQQ
jgi:2-C-methyl-D-erythritol 4-phosphate cytidylyltransferase